jgi:hypothetical protein
MRCFCRVVEKSPGLISQARQSLFSPQAFAWPYIQGSISRF